VALIVDIFHAKCKLLFLVDKMNDKDLLSIKGIGKMSLKKTGHHYLEEWLN
jgi:hypothetical protein